MKKTLLVAALALGLSSVAMAQENGSQDRAQMRAEMVQKNAERLAKDFELKGDAKSTFLKDFVAYQNELMGTIQMPQREQGKEEAAADKKKELTEAEAKAKIQESFERQEKMVAQMQKRLDIQKKYYESFSKILTPQQMVRIFNRQDRPHNFQRGQNGQREGFGGQGDRRGRGGFGGSRGFGGPGGF